jgi:hypothetical protein
MQSRPDVIRGAFRGAIDLKQLAKPAFACAAVVKSGDAVFQEDLALRFYDCCAAERRLRQLLQRNVLPLMDSVYKSATLNPFPLLARPVSISTLSNTPPHRAAINEYAPPLIEGNQSARTKCRQ